MMRPSRARGKPAIAQLDKLSEQQLEAMLEANNRTLNSSHFASTSTSQPDPITLRLLENNARIRARLADLRGMAELSSKLERSAIARDPLAPKTNIARRPSAAEDAAVALEREEERTRRLQDVVDQRAHGSSSGGLKILSPHKTEQLEREEAARSPPGPSGGLTSSASTRDLLRGDTSLDGVAAAQISVNGTNGRDVYDELSHIEKAARMRSFLHYGPSDSDLEWEMDEDADSDGDGWLAEHSSSPSDEDEDEDEDQHMASSGLISASASAAGTTGRTTPSEDDAMLGMERVIRVDPARVAVLEGAAAAGGAAGGLMPPGRTR